MMLTASAFTTLGSAAPEIPDERAALALLAAHVFDAWLDGLPVDVSPVDAAAHGASPAAPPERLFHEALERAFETMHGGPATDARRRLAVLELMSEAGNDLSTLGRPELAVPFLTAILGHSGTAGAEAAVTAQCLYARARALVRQGKLDETLADAHLLHRLATDAGLEYYRVRAGVIFSDVKTRLGDIPQAAALAKEVWEGARGRGRVDAEPIAAGQYGVTLVSMGRIRDAIPFLLHASIAAAGGEQTNCLIGLGVAFMALGHREAARDALEMGESQAVDVLYRARARLNLMRLAADLGDRAAFERWRALVLDGPIDPSMSPAVYCMMGEAYHLFGEHDAARASFSRAIAHGERYRINQWVFTAEAGLKALDAGVPPTPEPEPPTLGEVAPAIATVREMRAAMGGRAR
ncbi:MAG TPA: hypothetical protein VHM30_08590 [Gemmatimonadaceae bacterium]|nr:hypothetical protein [Gemmatimonadaceae bacterium]